MKPFIFVVLLFAVNAQDGNPCKDIGNGVNFSACRQHKKLEFINICRKRLAEYDKQRKRTSTVFDIQFDSLPQECLPKDGFPDSCVSIHTFIGRSGVYRIKRSHYRNIPFLLECDADWNVIQRRQDGSVDFYRNWSDYKYGFGIMGKEFFIGLDKLHSLTKDSSVQKVKLRIVMESDGETKEALYSDFGIGNESEGYALKKLGEYSGDAGDSLTQHLGAKFTTRDRDNDVDYRNCAVESTGAWWYKDCHDRYSNLNGKYGDDSLGKGINWKSFRGLRKSITRVTMMIKLPRGFIDWIAE